jgi:hypothetical protein
MRLPTLPVERPLEAATLELLREVLARGGHIHLRANSLSMMPTIAPGDRLTLGPPPTPQPQPGEIIAWAHGGRVRIHRVVSVEVGGVITRGDASSTVDGLVPHEEILGRLVQVKRPLLRRIRTWLGSASLWRSERAIG